MHAVNSITQDSYLIKKVEILDVFSDLAQERIFLPMERRGNQFFRNVGNSRLMEYVGLKGADQIGYATFFLSKVHSNLPSLSCITRTAVYVATYIKAFVDLLLSLKIRK
jgi:hypothetical protein